MVIVFVVEVLVIKEAILIILVVMVFLLVIVLGWKWNRWLERRPRPITKTTCGNKSFFEEEYLSKFS